MDNEPYLKAITRHKGASNKSKHIMVELHIVLEAYDAGDIEFMFMHMHTANIPSDGLTKVLSAEEYSNITIYHFLLVFCCFLKYCIEKQYW